MTKPEAMRRAAEDKRTEHHSLRGHGNLEAFAKRQRERMKAAGWLKQRGESALDVLLAVAIGAGLAAALFYGLSS